MKESYTYITKDYTITDGCVLDIDLPAVFVGIRSSMGRVLLRAVSEAEPDQGMFQRFEFLVLAVGAVTSEPIGYDVPGHWVLLGIVGSRTVYYRQIFE